MSNEQNGNGIDPLVSETYRELAEERTPEALNREVLRIAASEVRTRYAIARAWTRPLAWAATIGLSLVLVLQLADAPQPPASSTESADAARADQAPVETRGISAPEAVAPVSEPVAIPPDQDRLAAADEAAAAAVLEKRSRTDLQQQGEKVSVVNDTPVAAPRAAEEGAMAEQELPDPSYLSRDAAHGAREKARLQDTIEQEEKQEIETRQRVSGEQTATAESSAARSMTSFAVTAAEDDSELLCPESVRKTAAEWLECIVAIERTAPPELVDREYQALHERFPELGELSR